MMIIIRGRMKQSKTKHEEKENKKHKRDSQESAVAKTIFLNNNNNNLYPLEDPPDGGRDAAFEPLPLGAVSWFQPPSPPGAAHQLLEGVHGRALGRNGEVGDERRAVHAGHQQPEHQPPPHQHLLGQIDR